MKKLFLISLHCLHFQKEASANHIKALEKVFQGASVLFTFSFFTHHTFLKPAFKAMAFTLAFCSLLLLLCVPVYDTDHHPLI